MLRSLLITLFVTLPFTVAISNIPSLDSPNIVLIIADDLGYNELNFMNNTRGIHCPQLDTLAFSGVVLKNYYVQPICSPTRSALMTGRYPIALGTQANVIYWDTPWAPSLSNQFLPQYLQSLNFDTAMYGKWHLGMYTEAVTPWKRGFDSHAGYLQGCGSSGTHVASCCHASSTPTDDDDFICAREKGKDYRGYDWFTNGKPDVAANGTRTGEYLYEKINIKKKSCRVFWRIFFCTNCFDSFVFLFCIHKTQLN